MMRGHHSLLCVVAAQECCCVRVAFVDSLAQGRFAFVIAGIYISPGLYETQYNIAMPFIGGIHKRCVAIFIFGIHIGSCFDECIHRAQVASLCSSHQRGLSIIVCHVDIVPAYYQLLQVCFSAGCCCYDGFACTLCSIVIS